MMAVSWTRILLLLEILCTLHLALSAPFFDDSAQLYNVGSSNMMSKIQDSRYDRNCFFSPMNCVFWKHPIDMPVRRIVLRNERRK